MKNRHLFMIIFMLYLVHVVSPFSVPDDVQELLKKSDEKKDIEETTGQTKYTAESGRNVQAVNPNVVIQAPVQIKKEILPGDNNSFLINNILKIRVEVQLTGKELAVLDNYSLFFIYY